LEAKTGDSNSPVKGKTAGGVSMYNEKKHSIEGLAGLLAAF
jgi:hypothetical protein